MSRTYFNLTLQHSKECLLFEFIKKDNKCLNQIIRQKRLHTDKKENCLQLCYWLHKYAYLKKRKLNDDCHCHKN